MAYSRFPGAERPNVLFILTDQLRYDTLGFNGNSIIKTPNLDKLAASGAVFKNCYVQNPTCGPSRACLLTGRYARSHGLRRNGCALPEDQPTMMKHLRVNGYHTALVGKLHFQPFQVSLAEHPDYGFDSMKMAEVPTVGGLRNNAYLEWCQAQGLSLLKIGEGCKDSFSPYPFAPGDRCHYSSWVAEEAAKYIGLSPTLGRPFFLNLSFFDPHHPYTTPEPWYSMYTPEEVRDIDWPHDDFWNDKPELFQKRREAFGSNFLKTTRESWRNVRACYYGMVSHLDDCIGRVIRALEAANLMDNTIICFTTDHGDMQGDKGLFDKGPYHYQETVRIPAMIWAPPKFDLQQGQVVEDLVESIDLAPTLMQMCGVCPYAGIQGESLWREGKFGSGRQSVLIEDFHEFERQHCVTVFDGQWKYNRYEGEEYGELYDLENDPMEHINLWGKCPKQQMRMAEIMLERLIRSHDQLPLPHSHY